MFSDNQPDDRAYRTKKRLVLLALVILFMLSAAGALVMSRLVTPIPVPATQPMVQILTPPVRGAGPASGATAAALGPLTPSAATPTPTRDRQGTAGAGSSPTGGFPQAGTPSPTQTGVNQDAGATPFQVTPTPRATTGNSAPATATQPAEAAEFKPPADNGQAAASPSEPATAAGTNNGRPGGNDEATPIPLTPTTTSTFHHTPAGLDEALENTGQTTSIPPAPTVAATAENDRTAGNEEAVLISPTPAVTAASGDVPAATDRPANDINEITQISPTPALTAEAGNDTSQATGLEELPDDGGISPNGLPVTGVTTRPALYQPATLGLALGTIMLLLAAGFAAVHRIQYK